MVHIYVSWLCYGYLEFWVFRKPYAEDPVSTLLITNYAYHLSICSFLCPGIERKLRTQYLGRIERTESPRGFLGFLSVSVTSHGWPWPMYAACERHNAEEDLSHGTRQSTQSAGLGTIRQLWGWSELQSAALNEHAQCWVTCLAGLDQHGPTLDETIKLVSLYRIQSLSLKSTNKCFLCLV